MTVSIMPLNLCVVASAGCCHGGRELGSFGLGQDRHSTAGTGTLNMPSNAHTLNVPETTSSVDKAPLCTHRCHDM